MYSYVRVIQNGDNNRLFYIRTIGRYSDINSANAVRQAMIDKGHKVLDNLNLQLVEQLPNEFVCPNCKGVLTHNKAMLASTTTGIWQRFFHCLTCHLLEKEFEFELMNTGG